MDSLLSKNEACNLKNIGITDEIFNILMDRVIEEDRQNNRIGLSFTIEGVPFIGVEAWWTGQNMQKKKAMAVYEVLSEMDLMEIKKFLANFYSRQKLGVRM